MYVHCYTPNLSYGLRVNQEKQATQTTWCQMNTKNMKTKVEKEEKDRKMKDIRKWNTCSIGNATRVKHTKCLMCVFVPFF